MRLHALIRFLLYLSFAPDAAGIEFDCSALEHGSALDDATAAVKDRCYTAVGSLAKAKEILGRFHKELVPKGVALEEVGSLADAPTAYKRNRRASALPWAWLSPWRLGRSWIFIKSPPRCQRLPMV